MTKSVSPYALMVGNPAKQIGWVSEGSHRLSLDEKGRAVCEESGEEYFLHNNGITKKYWVYFANF